MLTGNESEMPNDSVLLNLITPHALKEVETAHW